MRLTSVILMLVSSLSGLLATSVSGQTLEVRDAATEASDITVAVGDTFTIEVTAQLGSLSASGISLYLAAPAAGLRWLSTADNPFLGGALFAGAVEFTNGQLAPEVTWGAPEGKALLAYAIVLGPGSFINRSRSGGGVIATLRAVCTAPIRNAEISIFSNAIHQTRVVLADGRSELSVTTTAALRVTAIAPIAAAARATPGSWGALKSRHLD